MNVSPSGVADSSVPDSVITNCGSGSGCQSYEECAGVSLKWMATTSVRSFSSIVPSSTCDALSAPVYNLKARRAQQAVDVESTEREDEDVEHAEDDERDRRHLRCQGWR